MLNQNELSEMGFIPMSHYKIERAFPPEWKLPLNVKSSIYKKLPLYIQVRYEDSHTNSLHSLRVTNQ
jgi:hypothetical protein